MDRLRVKLKKILNKDVTSLLNKYKIPLVSIAVVVILACIGLIVTYAFYQVVDTKPIIGGATTEISDLDIRIMAEERDVNGNGLGSYGLYPYIPKAGYKYNSTKSYCTNGSVINYDANNYDADITAYGHDVCYLYFDSTAQLDITLNVYAENVDSDGNGNGEYTKLETTALPTIGYELNTTRSSCKNGSTVSYIASENLFSVESSEKDVCDIYMDAMDVDIALKIYVQAKKNSTLYYEAKSIPTNNFYALGTKSACTGTSTMSMKNQKVVVSATGRTNCVAYLDVSSGPIPESMQNTVGGATGQDVTITFGNSNLGTTPTTYYYSSDNGATYVSSTSNTYTFTGLTPLTAFTFKAYSVDAAGNTSRILTTTAEIDYVLNKPFEYTNAAQPFDVIVTGYYKFEVWGAEGGYRSSQSYSGKGGYSAGTIKLNAGDKLYVYTGGQGGATTCSTKTSSICAGGFNGGGYRYNYPGGGGASDIRINEDSLLARVIVAGGGGSDGATTKIGMYGGGTSGGAATQSYGSYGYGGTQTGFTTTVTALTTQPITNSSSNYPGGFGFGGFGVHQSSGYAGAGGGGWYGGCGSVPDGSGDDDRGGGGGSGFVYTGQNVTVPSGSTYKITSQYAMTSTTLAAGNTSFTSPTGASETGHTGNGYAKVTFVGQTLE